MWEVNFIVDAAKDNYIWRLKNSNTKIIYDLDILDAENITTMDATVPTITWYKELKDCGLKLRCSYHDDDLKTDVIEDFDYKKVFLQRISFQIKNITTGCYNINPPTALSTIDSGKTLSLIYSPDNALIRTEEEWNAFIEDKGIAPFLTENNKTVRNFIKDVLKDPRFASRIEKDMEESIEVIKQKLNTIREEQGEELTLSTLHSIAYDRLFA